MAGICDATVSNLKAMHSVPARKIVRVYNGAAALKRAAKQDWPQKSGFTLVYVGRLEPVKNHALLLHAFRGALASMPELRLWMVGDGSERAAMERLAAELGIAGQVTFWGQQLDVAPFFSAADAFIMSSKSEGLPMSLLQAFSLGLPAIVTDVGGMAEVVRLSQAGLRCRRPILRRWPRRFCGWQAMKRRERNFRRMRKRRSTRALLCKPWPMPTWSFTGTPRSPASGEGLSAWGYTESD